MTLQALASLFVLAVLAHNAEEALFLPAWSRLAGRWHRPVASTEFRFAVAVLSLLLLAAAAMAQVGGPRSLASYLFFGYVFAMTANAIVPHLAATIATRRYMPGTATGLLLNLPLGVYLLTEAIAQGWVVTRVLLWAAPLMALALLAAIPGLFAAGRLLRRKPGLSRGGKSAA